MQNANSITEFNYYLAKRSDFFNKLYNVYINSNSEYETLFKTELTKLIIQFYTPYLEINPFDINVLNFPMSFIAWFKNDLRRLQNISVNNDEILGLCNKLKDIDFNDMLNNELKRISEHTYELKYNILLENIYNYLLDFSEVIPSPSISKT